MGSEDKVNFGYDLGLFSLVVHESGFTVVEWEPQNRKWFLEEAQAKHWAQQQMRRTATA